jgi:hypothetical protein
MGRSKFNAFAAPQIYSRFGSENRTSAARWWRLQVRPHVLPRPLGGRAVQTKYVQQSRRTVAAKPQLFFGHDGVTRQDA